MHFGIEVVTLGEYADPRLVVRLARAAESAGWEGLFVWDHLGFAWGAPSGDPWVILGAVAQATKRLRVGTGVTPVPRRRPHVLANTLATLDLLSSGRAILGVGLGGVPREFAAFGEPDDARERAAMLDEALALLDRLWSGETVTHHGWHYTVDEVALAPLPLQRRRIPLWVGEESGPALRRAARWDGWIIGGIDEQCQPTITVAQMAEKIATIREHRTDPGAFDVAITGCSTPGEGTRARAFAGVGVTWWLESLHGYRGSVEEMVARVEAGPPA